MVQRLVYVSQRVVVHGKMCLQNASFNKISNNVCLVIYCPLEISLLKLIFHNSLVEIEVGGGDFERFLLVFHLDVGVPEKAQVHQGMNRFFQNLVII